MLPVVVVILLTSVGSECDARRDPFCSDLEQAQRIERQWLDLDRAIPALRSFREPCVPGTIAAVRAARFAVSEKAKAYRRYYEHWLKLAADSMKGFSQGLARQADSRRAVEQLLVDAEHEYANVVQRMSSLPKDDASRRTMSELMRQVQQRISNLREALARWTDDRESAEVAAARAKTLRDCMQDAIVAVSAESVLWDAYYDGIATWNALRCGGPQ
jgi:hypothetical protein